MTATELTDQDRAAAREAWIASCAQQGDGKEWYLACAVYLAGKRAGASEQREADARICEEKIPRAADYGGRWGGYGPFHDWKTGEECAAAIRSQPTARKEE